MHTIRPGNGSFYDNLVIPAYSSKLRPLLEMMFDPRYTETLANFLEGLANMRTTIDQAVNHAMAASASNNQRCSSPTAQEIAAPSNESSPCRTVPDQPSESIVLSPANGMDCTASNNSDADTDDDIDEFGATETLNAPLLKITLPDLSPLPDSIRTHGRQNYMPSKPTRPLKFHSYVKMPGSNLMKEFHQIEPSNSDTRRSPLDAAIASVSYVKIQPRPTESKVANTEPFHYQTRQKPLVFKPLTAESIANSIKSSRSRTNPTATALRTPCINTSGSMETNQLPSPTTA